MFICLFLRGGVLSYISMEKCILNIIETLGWIPALQKKLRKMKIELVFENIGNSTMNSFREVEVQGEKSPKHYLCSLIFQHVLNSWQVLDWYEGRRVSWKERYVEEGCKGEKRR